MAHTPGPWRISGRIIIGVFEGSDVQIVQLSSQRWGGSAESWARQERWDAETEDNARLIAAAPEMLAALEEASRAMDAAMPGGALVKQRVRLAIASATGERTP